MPRLTRLPAPIVRPGANPLIATPMCVALPEAGIPDGAPVILVLPAMGTPASFYQPLALQLCDLLQGPVAIGELPGQGASRMSVRRGASFGYREIVDDCIPAYVEQLLGAFPERPLHIVGHSLGGQLAVLALPRIHDSIAGLVLAACGTAHYRAWGRFRLKAMATVYLVRFLALCLPWYPGRRLGFGGDQPRRLMRDWSVNATTGRYSIAGDPMGPRGRQAVLDTVSLPVLALCVSGDAVAPRRAAEELLTFIPSARPTHCEIAGVPAHNPWRRHFSWVREAAQASVAIAQWLRGLPDNAEPVSRTDSNDSPIPTARRQAADSRLPEAAGR